MPRPNLPLILSAAILAASFSSGLAAEVRLSSGASESLGSGASASQPTEEETRALRQSLFKKPMLPLFNLAPKPTIRKATRPGDPAPPRAIVIAPPPPPRQISIAERELSLQPASYTPYDRYSGSVKTVIARVENRPTTMARARALMAEAHRFRYRSGDPYQAALPEATAASRSGDCKAKSLWLYDQLGDPSALYVIGKTLRGTASNHAWVYWKCDSRWWLLDPTNRSTPIPADTIPKDRYIPYYSFGKNGAYRHRATWIYMPGPTPATPAVATPGTKPRVARQ